MTEESHSLRSRPFAATRLDDWIGSFSVGSRSVTHVYNPAPLRGESKRLFDERVYLVKDLGNVGGGRRRASEISEGHKLVGIPQDRPPEAAPHS